MTKCIVMEIRANQIVGCIVVLSAQSRVSPLRRMRMPLLPVEETLLPREPLLCNWQRKLPPPNSRFGAPSWSSHPSSLLRSALSHTDRESGVGPWGSSSRGGRGPRRPSCATSRLGRCPPSLRQPSAPAGARVRPECGNCTVPYRVVLPCCIRCVSANVIVKCMRDRMCACMCMCNCSCICICACVCIVSYRVASCKWP